MLNNMSAPSEEMVEVHRYVFDNAQKTIKEQLSENQKLFKDNIQFLKEVSTLKDTIIKLQTDNASLSNEVTALRTENNALKERIKRLEGKEV